MKLIRRHPRLIPITVVLMGAILLPIATQNSYIFHVFILIGLYSMMSIAWLALYKVGRLSLGQSAFMAVGAYFSSIVVTKLGFSFWVGLISSGFTAALIGLVVGYPTLRVGGIYFVIISFALAEFVRHGIHSWEAVGGHAGIAGIPGPNTITILGFQIVDFTKSQVSFYYLMLCLVAVCVITMHRLFSSAFGRACYAVAENEELARSIGIYPLKYQLIVFCLGSFFTGIAGSFYAHYSHFIHPDMFGVARSLEIQIYAIVGGLASLLLGPLTGSFLLIWLGESLRIITMIRPLVYSAIIIFVVIFFPGGILSLRGQKLGSGVQKLLSGYQRKNIYKEVKVK